MITTLPLLVLFVAVASGNPAVGKPWHWKSLKPLVTPIGPVKSSRIVGGTEATAHSYPHQVALFIDNTYLCGGALISDEWVLTAAHCMEKANFVDVVMGAHNIDIYEATQVTMTSTDFFVHEGWNNFALTNDIAVIRLPTPVTLNVNIQPVGLPATDVSEGTVVTPTGWGKSSDTAPSTSQVLLEVDVPVISNAQCNSVYELITGGNICTDGTGAKGTCDGDSGGPLNNGDKTYGISSFESTEGCESGHPDVYARVYHYLDWIEQMTGITP